MSSPHYNHPFWPSPRSARIARMLFTQRKESWLPVIKKPEGRLTHNKALQVMADCLNVSVHAFLHIRPMDALMRLKLASHEDEALEILGDNGINPWWIIAGTRRLPCCVCDRILPPAAPPASPVMD